MSQIVHTIRMSVKAAEAAAEIQKYKDQIVSVAQTVERYTTQISGEKGLKQAHNWTAAVAELGGATKDLITQENVLAGAAKLTVAEKEKVNRVVKEAIEKYEVLGEKAPTAMLQLAEATKKVEKDTRSLSDKLSDFGAKAQSVGTALSLSVTAPLVGAVAASLNLSGQFEEITTRLVSLGGVSADELGMVREHILDLAPAVGIGPIPLSEAMMKVSSTVSDTQVALEILDMAAKASAAGMGEPIQVASALTSIVNSYGAANITAAQAADILTVAVKDGGAEANELAPVFANVAPMAAQMGISFAEVSANIATFTKLGSPAAEAVTTLSSVMTALIKESKEGKEALGQIGLSYAQLRTEVKDRGLAATLTDLNEKFKGNETLLTQVFGRVEAVRNIMGTAGSQAETYAEVLEHLNQAAREGTALDDAFNAMKGKQVQTMRELRAQVEVVAIRFGNALAPSLAEVLQSSKPLLQDLEGFVKWFANLPDPIKETAIALAGIAVATGPVLYFLGSSAKSVSSLIELYKKLAQAQAVAGAVGAGAGATGLVATVAKAAPQVAVFTAAVYASAQALEYMSTKGAAQFAPAMGSLALPLREVEGATDDVMWSIVDARDKMIEAIPTTKLFGGGLEEAAGKAAAAANKLAELDQLQAEIDARTRAHWSSVDSAVNAAKDLADRIDNLKTAGDDWSQISEQLGARAASLAQNYRELGIPLDQLPAGVAKLLGLARATDEAGTSAAEAKRQAKQLADAQREIASAYIQVSDATRTRIVELRERGIGESEIAVTLGVTKTQIGLVMEAEKDRASAEKAQAQYREYAAQQYLKFVDDQIAQAQKLAKAIASNLEIAANHEAAADQLRRQRTLSTTDYQISELQRWVAEQKALVKQGADGWQQAYDAIDREAQEKYRAISDAAADSAMKQAMAAADVESAWLEAFEGLPKLMANAFTSGGNVGDAMKGWISQIGGEFGKKMFSDGPLTGLMGKAADGIGKLFGDKIGNAFAMAVPGIGSALGSLIGPLIGKVADAFRGEGAKTNDIRDEWMASIGGLEAAQAQIAKFNNDPQLMAAFDRLYTTGKIEEFKKAAADYEARLKELGVAEEEATKKAKELGVAEEEATKKAKELAEAEAAHVKAMADAVERYKVQWSDKTLDQVFLDLQAAMQGLAKDHDLLIEAGVRDSEVLRLQADAYNELIANAHKTGIEIPEDLKAVEDELERMGLLSDENRKLLGLIGETAEEAAAKAEEHLAAVNEAVKRYNTSWRDMTPARAAQELSDALASLAKDHDLLIDGGVREEATLRMQASAYNELIAQALAAGTQIPPALYGIAEQLLDNKLLTDENIAAMAGMAEATLPNWQAMQQGAEDYGISVEKLGKQFEQAKLNEEVGKLVETFGMMRDGGADMGDVLNNMSDEVQGFIDRAREAGVEVPGSLKEIAQQMVDAGLLTDETGEKLKDLSTVEFGASITDAADDVKKKLQNLNQYLEKNVPDAAAAAAQQITDSLKDIKDDELRAKLDATNTYLTTTLPDAADEAARRISDAMSRIDWNLPSVPGQDTYSTQPVYPQAEGGDYLVRRPTLFLAGDAGLERATFTPGGGAPAGSGTQNFVFNIGEIRDRRHVRELADRIARDLRQRGA